MFFPNTLFVHFIAANADNNMCWQIHLLTALGSSCRRTSAKVDMTVVTRNLGFVAYSSKNPQKCKYDRSLLAV